MIRRFWAIRARIRRWLSRSEWVMRILGLPRSDVRPEVPGLILIQIDGLSRHEVERALAAGRMPFLAKLLDREEYRLHSFYPGLPSTTPAVQAELLYGVKTAVPAIQYRDPQTHELTSLLNPQTAKALEAELAEEGPGLLEGGTAYVDIFTGGARDANFCAAGLGVADIVKSAGPIRMALALLAHAFVLVRMIALGAVELVLSVVDVFRGLVARKDLWLEIKFIPKRVALCILLREFCTGLAGADAARGVPVIHVNFIGYDEQSHRRGPDSAFAHWTLKGIDRSIRRIWRAARHSERRDCDLWVYSDHGQERCRAYLKVAGRPLQETVAELLKRRGVEGAEYALYPQGIQMQRTVLFGSQLLHRLFGAPAPEPASAPAEMALAQMGPVGHLYLPEEVRGQRAAIAGELATEGKLPAVFWIDDEGTVRVHVGERSGSLEEMIGAVFGDDRPNLEELTEDLQRLVRHRWAGDLALMGCRAGETPVSYHVESGAHGGLCSAETGGFALLPADAPLGAETHRRGRIRPLDLREAALRLRGRERPAARPTGKADRAPPPRTLRVLTYNTHSCVGTDGRDDPERIARVIAACDPDVVALQELDVYRARTRHRDQAQELARILDMEFHFHPSFVHEQEQYGNAILSRHPTRVVKGGPLPGAPGREPRGVLWAEIACPGGCEVQVLTTHFSTRKRERALQVEALAGPEWLGHPDCAGPAIVCGDFNSLPGSRVVKTLRQRLSDTALAPGGAPASTWMGIGRIDYVFASDDLAVHESRVVETERTRVASDHRPVIAELEIPGAADR
jgi:endonuclease/exonuclease/phosphatase family metal-dependent hydrolase